MPKPLSIIGLDPGTTTAYTILDLNSNLLQTHSSKQLPLSQIISQIIKLSQPLITTSDKQKTPSLVQEFSTKLGTLLITPKQDLKKQEKKDLTKDYQNKIQNTHQLDSLAAALHAYKKLKPTLIKINDFIKRNDLENLRNPFIQLILKESLNFESAKKILTQPDEEEKVVKQVFEEKKITKTDFLRLFDKLNTIKKEKFLLENKLSQLKQTQTHLKQTNLFLAKKLSQTNQQIETLLRFKEKRIKDFSEELGKKEKEKRLLLEEIKELKELFFNLENKVVMRKVKDLGRNFKKKGFEVKEGECLFVENPAVVSDKVWQELKEKGVKLFSKVRKKGVFVLDEVLDKGDFIIVGKELVGRAMRKRDILREVMEEYEGRG